MAFSPPLPQNTLNEAAAVILAAGKSTRMKSDLPKPLHRICGLPMTRHVIDACRQAGVRKIVVVIGHGADQVRQGLGDDVEYVVQAEQLGTGHAALCARSALEDHRGPVLVLAGDVPLLQPDTLRALVRAASSPEAAAAMLVATLEDPTGYGRVILDSDGFVVRIVEQKDASEQEAALKTWNPSVYCFKGPQFWERLQRVRADNAQAEYYLTDVIGLTSADGGKVVGVPVTDVQEVLGVNDRRDLASVTRIMRRRVLDHLMLSGVTVTDPETTYVDVTVRVGVDCVLEPQTHLTGATQIGRGCLIGPMTVVNDSQIGDQCTVVLSHLDGCVVEQGVRIGPYSRLRPGSVVGSGSKIGNFVEIKNSRIGENVSAAHLSYIGDADVGTRTNIGAGTITCNYDGFRKHRTVIGQEVFVGSDSIIVAPVTIEDGAMTAAGSVITDDVPADALGIGRARQVNREGWAARWKKARSRRDQTHG